MVVAEDLRLFLSPRRRLSGEVTQPLDGTSTLGHLVQAAGIPLTEVGRLLVTGRDVDPDRPPEPGDVVDVGAKPRPQPLERAAFQLDVHLGSLARRMRLLGLDTAYSRTADDAALVQAALDQRRMLLSQDRGLLKRTAVRSTAAFVRGAGAEAQLADVLDRFSPRLSPYGRCPACNGVLAEVAKAEVEAELEPGTRRTYDDFRRCRNCGRVYWRGAHATRLESIVRSALAAPSRR